MSAMPARAGDSCTWRRAGCPTHALKLELYLTCSYCCSPSAFDLFAEGVGYSSHLVPLFAIRELLWPVPGRREDHSHIRMWGSGHGRIHCALSWPGMRKYVMHAASYSAVWLSVRASGMPLVDPQVCRRGGRGSAPLLRTCGRTSGTPPVHWDRSRELHYLWCGICWLPPARNAIEAADWPPVIKGEPQ